MLSRAELADLSEKYVLCVFPTKQLFNHNLRMTVVSEPPRRPKMTQLLSVLWMECAVLCFPLPQATSSIVIQGLHQLL